jgi:phospholipid/cholesterol/gamma-HCH transport system permease protein
MSEAALQPGTVPTIRISTSPDGKPLVEVAGAWNLRSLAPVVNHLVERLQGCATDASWDLRAVTAMDHAGALILWRSWGRQRASRLILLPEHEPIFARLEATPKQEPAHVSSFDWHASIAYLGGGILSLASHLTDAVLLLGNVVIDAIQLLRRPQRIPWREISANIYHIGAKALGITALVGFLVGVVLSYLTGEQLRTYGAEIFIINLLGVSIIRELGPVLAAILIAGRSGSAMTAQLGVMRVTEELDAMQVMGIPHTIRLILPKMIALAIAMPLIILWTDAVALFGGMMAAQVHLGLDYQFFLSALPEAVPLANLWLGLGKGVVFGLLIALVACHFGLRIEANTESLGQGTTSSVVTAITIVIIVDAVFAVMFSSVGVF